MAFLGPVGPNNPDTLQWKRSGTVLLRVVFTTPNIDPAITLYVSVLGLTPYSKKAVIGDTDFSDDIIELEPFEEILLALNPSQRRLTVDVYSIERAGTAYTFSLRFYSKDGALPDKDYNCTSTGAPDRDTLYIPVKLV